MSKDYKLLLEVSEAMVTLAMIRLMLHRLVHPIVSAYPAVTSQTGCQNALMMKLSHFHRSPKKTGGCFWLVRFERPNP